MEHTAELAPENAEVLYDLAVIRLAAGEQEAALEALSRAVDLSAKLRFQARGDDDLKALRGNPEFEKLIQ
jgi:thioredoxin-like negative regulator of GroEL